VQTAIQPFAVAYQLDTVNHFLWTYPSSTDVLIANSQNVLRWQTNISDNASIEYSVDGNVWQPLAATIDVSKKYYKWHLPDIVTKLQLRLTTETGNQQFISPTFISSRQINMNVGFNCTDSFLLFWNNTKSEKYRVYQLGSKYLEPFLDQADTSIVLTKLQHPSSFYSVSAVIDNREGLRSPTINYTAQGVECYLRNFLASVQNNEAVLSTELGTTYNIASVSFQKINGADTQTIKTFIEPGRTSFTYNDPGLSRGVNRYRVIIRQNDGSKLYSNIEAVSYFPDLPVIIYPNPAAQNKPINIIVQEAFIYSIQVYDALGRLIRTQKLDDPNNQIQPLVLSKGLYFIKIITGSGRLTTQKLIVQ
jgi:hypothetical protein